MTHTPAPPPGWAEAALQAGTELGLGSAFAEMEPADRDRVCRRAGQILAGQGQALPPGWDRAMTRLLGGAESDGPADDALARDTADTVLAEKGKVFAPEDDA